MAASTNGLMPLITPPSPGLNVHANSGPKIIAVSVTLIVIAAIAVILRFVSRILSKAGLWWDDWAILLAMLVSWGACICMIVSTHYGFGRHMEDLGGLASRLEAAHDWFILFYIYETVYTVAVVVTKYSILLFYSRIFKDFYFRLALWLTTGLVTAWFIAIETSVIVQCLPIHALWDIGPGRCVDLHMFFQGSGVSNAILNVIVLLLPLPMVWTLQVHAKHKLALSGVFLLGSFVVIVSVIRVVILARLEQVDITWSSVDSALWTSVEPVVGVCSACLPIMRSLWIRSRDSVSDSELSDTARSIRSLSSVKVITKPRKARTTSFTSHTPLNELSADGELTWNGRLSVHSSHSRATSGTNVYTMDFLPIQKDDLIEHSVPTNTREVKKGMQDTTPRSHIRKYKEDIAELYG